MIPIEQLSTLFSAAYVNTNSKKAFDESLIIALAKAINMASNTGETQIIWTSNISAQALQELTTNGYAVTERADAYGKEIPCQYLIKWG